GVGEEALEPEHAGRVQGGQLGRVAGHRAAPEPDVDPALPGRGGPLALQAAGIQAAYPLAKLEPDPARSIANAAILLRQVGRIIAVEQLAS
ncbi:MAG TPA: hypothetical protein VK390_00985, partial [Propionibacteriaceae bacterium]|nr:hypothetical protein [Propionibacteriaceae bacterium]